VFNDYRKLHYDSNIIANDIGIKSYGSYRVKASRVAPSGEVIPS